MEMPPFNLYLGIELTRRESGRSEVALELGPQHLNRRGVAHGGVITALLDSALGAAVISAIPEQWWCATTSLSVNFIGGATGGRLRALGCVTRRGSRIAFASGEIRTESDELIATAQGSWHLWNRNPGLRPSGPTRGAFRMRGSGELISVGKVIAVGRNYEEHVKEMQAPTGSPPVVFLKPASAVVGGMSRLALPQSHGAVHHELELAVAIGRGGSRIDREAALEHVLGYGVALDLTLRDLQQQAKQSGSPWTLSKGFPDSAPLSPIAERDEVGDAAALTMELEVNGELRQQGTTAQMISDVPALIAHISRWMQLDRGDVILTGTPAGVGPLRVGDEVLARIDRVGELRFTVDAADD